MKAVDQAEKDWTKWGEELRRNNVIALENARKKKKIVVVGGGASGTMAARTLVERGHNHGGGDNILVSRLYGILTDQTPVLTSLTESAESHLMGISAEESRLNGGVLVKEISSPQTSVITAQNE